MPPPPPRGVPGWRPSVEALLLPSVALRACGAKQWGVTRAVRSENVRQSAESNRTGGLTWYSGCGGGVGWGGGGVESDASVNCQHQHIYIYIYVCVQGSGCRVWPCGPAGVKKVGWGVGRGGVMSQCIANITKNYASQRSLVCARQPWLTDCLPPE
jgi:hypothetical protein